MRPHQPDPATAPIIRLARLDELPLLAALMEAAIGELQTGFLNAAQIAASHAIMGLDQQLLHDGTYFAAELDGALVGCGGWSMRTTLYGGDHSAWLREPRPLDPATDPARIRAMYTAPGFARRGIGRAVLQHCEAAARAEGFQQAELMATLAGEPLYRASGYRVMEAVIDTSGGAPVPLRRMIKTL